MRVMPLERVPPQSTEAEQGVLGSMLLERDAIARVVEMIRGDDFYREAHRRIYETMVDLFERGEPVDLITVTDRLKARGQLDDVGGAAYVTSLLDAVPTAANVEYYARLVLQKSLLRQLIAAGTDIVGMGFREEQEVEVLLDQAEKLVFGIASRRMAQDFVPIRDVLQESFDRIDKRYQDKGTTTGVPTGFTDLDRMTAGLQPADLVIVAARPAMGKCLKYDAEIVDAQTGAVRTIQEVVGAGQATLFSLDESMRLSPTAPSQFVDDGIKPVFRVRLASGRDVETTLSHPFLTPQGWRALHDLSPGTLVAVPRRIPVFGALDLPAHEVGLLAYLTSGRLPVSASLAADFADAVAVAEAIRLGQPADRARRSGIAISGGSQAAEVVDVLRARFTGLDGPSAARFIPPEVATLRREKLALFLNRLLAATGEISGEGENLTLDAEMLSARIARQAQHLLLRFGVVSVVAGNQLRIGPAGMVPLIREVGVFGHERLRRWARNQQHSLLEDVDVMWDPIVAIDETGAFQVYDLTIPRTHNFIANDVCVHNTTFCLNIAQHAALQHKTPVAIFSLETSDEQVVQRMLASEAEVDGSKLRTGFLSDTDWPKLAHAMARLSEAPIFIDDSAAINVIEMRAKARKLKAEHGLGLIIIDYLQMTQSYRRTENRTQEISEIARATKSLAKELNVPVIAISQLSRAVEALGNRRPQLSHLRECVTADTVVWDADTGRRYTVGDLARLSVWPRLLSLDQRGKLVPVRPAAVLEKGKNDVFEIRTSAGHRLRATANHPVLTPEGWKTVGSLHPGSLVAATRRLPVVQPGPSILSPERMRLLGYLIGDGSYQRHRGISFISSDPVTFEDCIVIAEREFGVLARRGQANGTPEVDLVATYAKQNGSGRAYGRPYGNPLREWLRGLRVEGQSSYDKRIPERVFTDADAGGLRALLRALFSTDGCLTRRRYRNGAFLWSLHYDTVSVGLAEDVRDLLLRFGIVAQVSSGYMSKKATVPIYRVCIEDATHLASFCRLIGIEGRKSALVERCMSEVAQRRVKPQVDRLPYAVTEELWNAKKAVRMSWRELGFRLQTGKTLDRPTAAALAERLGETRVMEMATNDILWDRVTRITPAGGEIVYDLVMPGTHNFVANGLIAHNSGELEQVADLVLFIYREDYYNENTEKKNIAEIIISKHRNGPTGTIELYFNREHSRFIGLDRRRSGPNR